MRRFSTILPVPVRLLPAIRLPRLIRPTGRGPMKTRIRPMILPTGRSIWTRSTAIASCVTKPTDPAPALCLMRQVVFRRILPTVTVSHPDVIQAGRAIPRRMICPSPLPIPMAQTPKPIYFPVSSATARSAPSNLMVRSHLRPALLLNAIRQHKPTPPTGRAAMINPPIIFPATAPPDHWMLPVPFVIM